MSRIGSQSSTSWREYLAVLESAGYLVLYDSGRAASDIRMQLAMKRIGTYSSFPFFSE